MRTIKFRVWDKKNKKMLLYDRDLVPHLTLNGVLETPSKTANMIDYNTNVSADYILSQFTGLIDKNGKEIYEGDLVQINPNNHSSIIGDIGTVEWVSLRCRYWIMLDYQDKYKNQDRWSGNEFFNLVEYVDKNDRSYDDVAGDEVMVIGNIWANPELRKEDEHA